MKGWLEENFFASARAAVYATGTVMPAAMVKRHAHGALDLSDRRARAGARVAPTGGCVGEGEVDA